MINEIDFIIPLHRYHYLLRTVLEAIEKFYLPRRIYIITPQKYLQIINTLSKNWLVKKVIVLEEENFFEKNYNLNYNSIYGMFNQIKDEKSREFGWWYQQLIKIVAFKQIINLSDPYIVWDSDLIPLKRWNIYPNEKSNYYKFAILQENPRSIWNNTQYDESLYDLIGLHIEKPKIGTFVSHHFIMHHHILNDLINHIENKNKECWIISIIKLSHKYFRFSEYNMIASFMKKYYPELLHYYSYNDYGKFGERIRDPKYFLIEMENFIINKENGESSISYQDFLKFVLEKYNKFPSYLQIEHI